MGTAWLSLLREPPGRLNGFTILRLNCAAIVPMQQKGSSRKDLENDEQGLVADLTEGTYLHLPKR